VRSLACPRITERSPQAPDLFDIENVWLALCRSRLLHIGEWIAVYEFNASRVAPDRTAERKGLATVRGDNTLPLSSLPLAVMFQNAVPSHRRERS
jgi:hypothetical protein